MGMKRQFFNVRHNRSIQSESALKSVRQEHNFTKYFNSGKSIRVVLVLFTGYLSPINSREELEDKLQHHQWRLGSPPVNRAWSQ